MPHWRRPCWKGLPEVTMFLDEFGNKQIPELLSLLSITVQQFIQIRTRHLSLKVISNANYIFLNLQEIMSNTTSSFLTWTLFLGGAVSHSIFHLCNNNSRGALNSILQIYCECCNTERVTCSEQVTNYVTKKAISEQKRIEWWVFGDSNYHKNPLYDLCCIHKKNNRKTVGS